MEGCLGEQPGRRQSFRRPPWVRLHVSSREKGGRSDAASLDRYETSENARMTGLPAVRFGSGAATYLSLQQQTLFASNGKGGLAFFYVASPDADAEGIQFVFDFGSYPTKGYGAYMTRQKTGFYTPSAKAGADLSHKFDEKYAFFCPLCIGSTRPLEISCHLTPSDVLQLRRYARRDDARIFWFRRRDGPSEATAVCQRGSEEGADALHT